MPLPEEGRQRVVIEGVKPEIDAGRFPIKRVIGDDVVVEADLFADGHDVVSGYLLFRHEDQTAWSRVPLEPLGNDRWRGQFHVERQGRYRYTISGEIDHFRSWRRDLVKRLDAGQDVRVDVQIGVRMVQEVARTAAADDAQHLEQWCSRITTADPTTIRVLSQDPGVLELVDRLRPPHFPTHYARELVVVVDRERAMFSAWYEMFPRSASTVAGQHGTLKDVIRRLPYVAGMGFDVLYLPPIHPIGFQFRKGPNNSVTAGPDDDGCPWAIGSDAGGHKSILSELGTFADFDELVRQAKSRGIDVAMDVAFQCSPDHPWVKAHPEWFTSRPDGTIQYAEHPPKKYQDIYPINFESSDWKNLWAELKSVFEFWIGHGVTIFRVDNPHTKAFPFWEWCITSLKHEHPELIFLSEAFTRPRLMYRLAKLGFSQSYTYFAWRHSRHELAEYLTELTQTEVAEFFRPNFWPNTPDILTEELQQGGRPAFMRRLILAATLSSNYGIYGPPFEHGWVAPLKPGSEEYLNSEKYEVHTHDLERPDSHAALITRVNRIRRDLTALQSNDGLAFHPVDNDQLLCYSKSTRNQREHVVVVVNLDSHYRQSGFVELPIHELGIAPDEPYQMHDLLTDARYMWYGNRNYVELDPLHLPAHIFRIRRRTQSESGREYFQ